MIYTIDQIRDVAVPVAEKHGIQSVYLFGSYARGEATEESDVDIRIDSDAVLGLFELGGIYADLGEGLGKKLDLVTTRGTEEEFLNMIKAEELLLYET